MTSARAKDRIKLLIAALVAIAVLGSVAYAVSLVVG